MSVDVLIDGLWGHAGAAGRPTDLPAQVSETSEHPSVAVGRLADPELAEHVPHVALDYDRTISGCVMSVML